VARTVTFEHPVLRCAGRGPVCILSRGVTALWISCQPAAV